MRRIAVLFVAILALSLTAKAQDESPRFEVFGGYDYVHFSVPTTQGNGNNITSNLNGGGGGAAIYLNKWLGIVGDFAGFKVSTLSQSGAGSISTSGTIFTYLFGPRVRFGSGPLTPFVQVLFGGAHNGDITTNNGGVCGGTPPCNVFKSASAFALSTGGGVDIKIARHFAVRGQAEYLLTKFNDHVNNRQNNARVFAGIVIH